MQFRLTKVMSHWQYFLLSSGFSLVICPSFHTWPPRLGSGKLAHDYGILTFFAGLGNSLGLPIIGWFYDWTQTYNTAFYFSGLCILLGVLFYCWQPWHPGYMLKQLPSQHQQLLCTKLPLVFGGILENSIFCQFVPYHKKYSDNFQVNSLESRHFHSRIWWWLTLSAFKIFFIYSTFYVSYVCLYPLYPSPLRSRSIFYCCSLVLNIVKLLTSLKIFLCEKYRFSADSLVPLQGAQCLFYFEVDADLVMGYM